MKKTTILFITLLLLVSCKEGRGKYRKRYRLPKEKNTYNSKEFEIGIPHFEGSQFSLFLNEEGVISESKLLKTQERYLRQKILNMAFRNLRDATIEEEITIKDEYRFFPGEIGKVIKVKANENLIESNSSYGGWSLRGKLKFQDFGSEDKIKDVIVSLGSISKLSEKVTYYGQDLLRKRNGQPLQFLGDEFKEFTLSYRDLPINVLNEISKMNRRVFVEVQDLKLNKIKLRNHIEKNRENKTRLIVSTAEEDQVYFLNNGESLFEFLQQMDPEIKLDYKGKISSFLEKEEDDMFSYAGQVILDDLKLYGNKKIWWSNISKPTKTYKADGTTVVLAFSKIKELRSSQLVWEKSEFKLSNKMKLSEEKISGKIIKISTEYNSAEVKKVIPYEIGETVCMEGYDRKRSDCSTHWRAAFSYPTARFRNQTIKPNIPRRLEEKELKVGDEFFGNFLEAQGAKQLMIKNDDSLKEIPGGFVGWETYDSRLNSYETRSPFHSLVRTKIKQGYSSVYYFDGWKLVYPYMN